MPDCPSLPRPAASPQASGATPLMVSIHVPISGASPGQVRGLLATLARLEHPAFEVLVVDYDTADPGIWEAAARECARLDPRFRFFHLGRWPGGQAGALNFARVQTACRAEFIAVLDLGAVLSGDWLDRAMLELADPLIGAIRSPCVVRRAALDEVGGWAEWCADEAAALEVALLRRHWRLGRLPQPVGAACQFGAERQRVARLAYGAAQIARRHWRPLLSPSNRELSRSSRWRIAVPWVPWTLDALILPMLLSSLALSAAFAGPPFRNPLPIFVCMLPVLASLTLRFARIRADGASPAFIGLALSHAVAKAVWGGVLNRAPPQRASQPVRQELALLLLTWAALAGTAHAGLATWPSRLWCALLLLQSLPYLATVCAAALQAGRSTLAQTGAHAVARTGAGD